MGCMNSRDVVTDEISSSNRKTINDNFIKEAFDYHNELRKQHGAPNLVLNMDLSKFSQNHADFLANNNLFEHSTCKWGNKRVGENLAMTIKAPLTAKTMTDLWYNEIQFHNFKISSPQVKSENFSQLIWKDSKEVGFGLAKGVNNNWIAVAHYFPAGNIKETFSTNVGQKK